MGYEINCHILTKRSNDIHYIHITTVKWRMKLSHFHFSLRLCCSFYDLDKRRTVQTLSYNMCTMSINVTLGLLQGCPRLCKVILIGDFHRHHHQQHLSMSK